jgi:hypothetical protein
LSGRAESSSAVVVVNKHAREAVHGNDVEVAVAIEITKPHVGIDRVTEGFASRLK